MRRIEDCFAADFAAWGLRLPRGAARQRGRGELRAKGWRIQYLFGQDERGEYLDYYASHRMADDRHVRLYATGERVGLPSIVSCYLYDARVPGDEERRREAYFARNRATAEELRRKGFLRSEAAEDGD